MKHLTISFFLFLCVSASSQNRIYVSPTSKAGGNGTITLPLRSIQEAINKAGNTSINDIEIILRKGKYFLSSALLITPAVLQNRSLRITSYPGEKVIISGADKIFPKWAKWKDKAVKADIGKDLTIDQLYCNGKVLPMARYPNYNAAQRVFNGTAPDAINNERVKKWSNPKDGYVHALHKGEWGGFHYRITGVDTNGELQLEGGWQNNRPSAMNKQHRFVENIFEELDAPGEWYYNKATGVLYYYPLEKVELANAVFEYSVTDELIHIKGSEENPVKNVSISGIEFIQTNRTFMKTKEPLLRSDWTIYRGAAILVEGAENIKISNCSFHQLGGNAIFVSNYNRKISIEGNEIKDIGGNAVAFVGNPDAVHSPSFQYSQFIPGDNMDKQPGPKSNNYPAQCTVYNNLIHDIGKIEKQVAGVQISMASEINISHNTIYNVPRAGINIGDGCWGGHVIEYNDVFNTVLETGDHGAFNSWGRDRFWLPDIKTVDSLVDKNPGMPYWDVVKPIILRNNRFHCKHGWDIDLDDGSSNYHIYNNICLNGGLKLREGYGRIVENNIMINNSFHPHVWYAKSMDVFKHNIVSANYAPIGIHSWGKEVDSNFFLLRSSLEDARKNNTDLHSISGDPLFENVATGNYRLKKNAPAFSIGFKNFPVNNIGVIDPVLKSKAAKTPVPDSKLLSAAGKNTSTEWNGAVIKSIETLGERSAAGLFDEKGVLILRVKKESLAEKSGLKERDVIRAIDNKPIADVREFLAIIQLVKWQGDVKAIIQRNQKEQEIVLLLK